MKGDPPAVWLSNLIADRLSEPGWSQDRIALEVGVSQAAVSKWVKGTARIQLDQAIRLAPVLDQEVVPFVHRLWPDLADADPVPPELREILRAAADDQLVEVIARARSVVETGQRTQRARRATVGEATNDEFAYAAADDGDDPVRPEDLEGGDERRTTMPRITSFDPDEDDPGPPDDES